MANRHKFENFVLSVQCSRINQQGDWVVRRLISYAALREKILGVSIRLTMPVVGSCVGYCTCIIILD